MHNIANLADIHPEIIRKPNFPESHTLPETNSKFAPENRPNPKRKGSSSNHSFSGATPPKFFTWPLKNDAWKMSFLLGLPIFRG